MIDALGTPATVEEVIRLSASGAPLRFLCFYGHSVPSDGSIGSTCLSQWYPAPFVVGGTRYPTAEHWMMAGKARLFADDEMLEVILASRTPSEAKKAGRRVRGFRPSDWEAARFDLVVGGNVHKFSQNEALRDYLLATGDAVLVEASPRDRIWGIGMSATNPNATIPARWRGRNLLGFALMQARARLKV